MEEHGEYTYMSTHTGHQASDEGASELSELNYYYITSVAFVEKHYKRTRHVYDTVF